MQAKINKQSGQITVEYILLAVVFIVLFQVASNTLKNNDYLKNFQDTPRKIFVNMVQNGNWEPILQDGCNLHPNHYNMHFSSDGDD